MFLEGSCIAAQHFGDWKVVIIIWP